MKKLKLFLILLLGIFFQQAIAQKQDSVKKEHHYLKRRIKNKDSRIFRPNPDPTEDDCVFTNRFSINQRLKRYPFNKAIKIVAVSYLEPRQHKDSIITNELNEPDTIFKIGLHINKGKLNKSSIIEIKELNSEEISKLTNVLYNTSVSKESNYLTTGPTCYNPRNAFIFYDRNGKIFDYLEVCFECEHYESQSHKVTVGSFCNQKFDLLKKIFVDIGIKYGTN